MRSYTLTDFKPKDKVVMADCGCRNWDYRVLRDAYVLKVGRKVITVAYSPNAVSGFKFVLNPNNGYGLTLSGSGYNMVFLTEQDYDDYCGYLDLQVYLRKKLWEGTSFNRLNYDQLISIKNIIGEEDNNE